MIADFVTGLGHRPRDGGQAIGVRAELEKRRLHAQAIERVEKCGRALAGTIVEGERQGGTFPRPAPHRGSEYGGRTPAHRPSKKRGRRRSASRSQHPIRAHHRHFTIVGGTESGPIAVSRSLLKEDGRALCRASRRCGQCLSPKPEVEWLVSAALGFNPLLIGESPHRAARVSKRWPGYSSHLFPTGQHPGPEKQAAQEGRPTRFQSRSHLGGGAAADIMNRKTHLVRVSIPFSSGRRRCLLMNYIGLKQELRFQSPSHRGGSAAIIRRSIC